MRASVLLNTRASNEASSPLSRSTSHASFSISCMDVSMAALARNS